MKIYNIEKLLLKEFIKKENIISTYMLNGEFNFLRKAYKTNITISNIGVKHGSAVKFSDLVLLDAGVYR